MEARHARAVLRALLDVVGRLELGEHGHQLLCLADLAAMDEERYDGPWQTGEREACSRPVVRRQLLRELEHLVPEAETEERVPLGRESQLPVAISDATREREPV